MDIGGAVSVDDVLKKMRPVIATLAMAALSRQTASTGAAGQVSAASMTDNIGSLASFLDMNKDGSMVDDVAGFVYKRLKRRPMVLPVVVEV